jgi:cytochrome c553
VSRTTAALALGIVLLCRALPAYAYDAAAGRQKAEETCAACHGPDGNSQVPEIPSLAGQQPRYIIMALFQFRSGHRQSEQMAPFAAELSDEDLGNLAAYYAAQKPAPPTQSMDPEKAAAARRLADADHCTQCHGPSLTGQEHIPRLAGQHFEYLKQQLVGFRAGTRGDIDGNMTSAAQPLSDADIDMLAQYCSTLSPP